MFTEEEVYSATRFTVYVGL